MGLHDIQAEQQKASLESGKRTLNETEKRKRRIKGFAFVLVGLLIIIISGYINSDEASTIIRLLGGVFVTLGCAFLGIKGRVTGTFFK